ncbi:hypothetical protein QQG09_08090 [Melissococcus plutonius]|nr:hypothetical protein [Melissococcus plutonius]AIM25893.1 hypothetical protein MEPL_c013670 [Melissococcus plutonius S1]KMT23885.1 hypothetical protein MEPL2_3c00890 [Melissococcus plutonius]KMT24408.1 hypothetical protein MEPL3_6c00890 [Melissococcus plutonius]KMT25981.1 hypothetical protein MEPL1_6c00890 [Melissococcus plutonius]KMT28531.1 hypothetical protein MEPL4_5c00890 [Melissococcus plutonius]
MYKVVGIKSGTQYFVGQTKSEIMQKLIKTYDWIPKTEKQRGYIYPETLQIIKYFENQEEQ